MLSEFMTSLGAGAAFGTALTVSGVYLPEVIINQMRMKDFHMLEVFLSATAISALLLMAMERWGFAKRSIRSNSTIDWFSSYDGNILGGALIGSGMSLSGACPGTILVQAGHGVPSSGMTMLGALIGGLVYSKYGKPSMASNCQNKINTQPGPQTIASRFEINERTVLLGFEVLAVSIVILSSMVSPGRALASVPTVVGGLLVGGIAQTVSMILTGNTIGASVAYEHAGAYIWKTLRHDSTFSKPPKLSRPVVFGLGATSSSFVLAVTAGYPRVGSIVPINPIAALVGGIMLSYGARVAGGCTSGHGLSGLSMLSYSSLITVMAMFAAGITTASMLY